MRKQKVLKDFWTKKTCDMSYICVSQVALMVFFQMGWSDGPNQGRNHYLFINGPDQANYTTTQELYTVTW